MTNESATFQALDVTLSDDPNEISVAYLADLKRRVSVARVGDQLVAFDDLCTCTDEARHCPLSAGRFDGTTIMCQCHGSEWDALTGAVRRGPAERPLVMHAIRQDGDQVQIQI